MKTNGTSVDNKQHARINWTKIAGKAGNGAKSLFEPVMPATFNTISSSTSVLRDLRNTTRVTKSIARRQRSAQENSAENRRSLNLFKSALDDIKSGNFGMDRINDEMFDDYETDTAASFNMPTGDEALDMSTEEILLLGNKGVAQSVIQSTSAQLRGLEASSKALIRSNIKSTQAMAASINNTLSFGFGAINTTLNIQNQKLDNINHNLRGILEFNNKNAIEYYTKSLDMLSGLGKMMENLDKSMNPDIRKRDRRYDTSSGFDPRTYMQYVKEGFKESLFGTGAEMMKGSGSNMKDFGIMGILSDILIPKTLKKPLEKFDKSLTRFFDEGFKRLGETLNKNPLMAMLGLGDIFGSRRESVKSLNLGSYMKNATPWNGIAQKALTEVIPELLTSIDSKLDNSEKRYYDYERGHFKTKSKIEEDMRNEYFDTFSMSLKESMDKLTAAVQSTGKSTVDQESLISAIQGIIDDQVSGKKDTMGARRDMHKILESGGVDKLKIDDFIMEFQSGLEGAISRINDLYHEIGSTQHVYRNVNNTYGDRYSDRLKKSHSENRGQHNYRSFSFTNNVSSEEFVDALRRKAGINDTTIMNDRDFVNMVLDMRRANIREEDIIKEIKRYGTKATYANKASSFIDRRFGGVKRAVNSAGGKLDSTVDSVTSRLFDFFYMGETKSSGKSSKVKVNAPATTRMSQKAGALDSKELKAQEQITALATRDYDKVIDQSVSQNDRDQLVLSSAIETFRKSPMATTVEESILKSNNIVFATLSTMLASFKGFTSRLFGKEGFFAKMWNSDARKKATDKLKDKLFTGENAIFKKQYDGAKAGLKSLKEKTLGYLGDGYDFLYDNTMQYMYGEDYQNEERWKNNRFISQTLNRKWRAEQKKAKEQSQVDNLTNENSVASVTENTTGALLGLPEHATLSRKEMEKRYEKARKIAIEGRGVSSKYSTEEIDAATEELKYLKEKLRQPIEETSTALIEIGDTMVAHARATAEAAVGDLDESTESKQKAYKSDFFKKLKSTAPKALAAGIAGAGIGLLNSKFSLLGSMFLPGGPVAGAIVGSGLAILSQTEAFKTFMFGKMDPNTQKREGGLISSKMQGTFKKMLPFAVGGAVLGGLRGLAKGAMGFDGGLGVLGMQILPGGILGGALLGAGMGILKNSEGFNKMLFGEKGEDGKRHGKFLSDSFNKMKGGFAKFLPKLGRAGAGLGIGALTGAVLQNAGYIPAMFSMGGPVGMGVVGLGLGIASSTKKFNEWMFGSEELDENGNPTGKRRKDGMLTRVKNILMTNVVEPISDTFKSKMLDLVDWTKDKVTYPFRLAFGPILDSLIGIKDNIVDFAKDKFEALGNGIMDIFRKTTKTLFSPITKAFGFVGKSILGIASSAAKLAMSPASVLLQGAQVLTAGKRRKEYMEFYKNYYSKGNISGALRDKWDAEAEAGNKRNIFSKISDTIGAYTGHGDIADAARAGWNNQMEAEGKNHLNWRSVHQERLDMRKNRDVRRVNEKQWRNIDRYRSKIINGDLSGREVELTDYQFEKYRDKFKRLGISEEHLQSSQDIMDLLYRKNDFKKKLDPTNTGSGLVVEETPAQKEAREKTEAYQEHVKSILDKVAERMGVAAAEVNEKQKLRNAKEEWDKDKKNLAKRLKKARITNVDLSSPELQDFDINEVDDDRLTDYRYSRYYQSGDFLGFLKGFKITQKSKYKSSDSSETPATGLLGLPEHSSANVNDPKSPAGILQRISDNIKSLLNVTEEQKEINSAQLEIATSGEIDDDTVKKKKGKSFGSRIMGKFNAVTSWLGFKKKKDKAAAEAAEDPGAAESSATLEDGESDNKDGAEEEKNGFGKLWDKIKSIGKLVGNSVIGGLFLKGIKFLGPIGLLGTVGFTIAELIRPGTAEKVGKSIDNFNQAVLDGDITWNTVMNGLKEKISGFGDMILAGAKNIFGEEKVDEVINWYKENIAPKVDAVKSFILDVIPEWAKATGNFLTANSEKVVSALSTVIANLAPPLITAFVQVVPTIAAAIVKGILGGLGNLGEKALEKLGWKKADSKVVDKKEAELDFEISGTRSVERKMTTKYQTSEAQAMSTLNSKSEATRNTVIQNAATGQYYIYDDEEQTQTRKYLDDEAASVLLEDPEMAPNVWYDPNTGAYFVEEASYEQYANNIYITSDGKVKAQGHNDINVSVGKVGLQMGVRMAQGLPALSKGAKTILKGSGKIAKGLGKMSLGIFNAFGKVGKAVGGMVKTGAKGIGWVAKKVFKPKNAAAVITESAEKSMPKILEKILKAFKGIKDSKAVKKVFEKFKKSLTTSVDDILTKFVSYLDDIATKNLGKATGNVAAKISTTVSKKIGKSALTSVPLITVVAGVWGLVDGALSAANLFEVPEDDVDWKMRLISALMECLLSISVGCWIDLLFDIVDLVSGLDLKHEIAMFLYKLLSGFDAESIEKITNSQENLAAETQVYNALNDTNMDTKAYNDKTNKTIWGKMWSGVKGVFQSEQTKYEESGQKYADYTKVLTKAGYTSDQISKMTKDQVTSAVKDNINNGALTGNSLDKAKKSLGMGTGTASFNRGMYAQGDPRWGKMPIGTLPDGSVATMDRAGCGPTAMAAVANTVAERSMGYGPVTPGDMGAYAASNGYISQGGANAGLFTEGAERMGLKSSPISNPDELKQNLLAGKPAVLTGKSSSASDPYTSAGHIVMADGLYGNKMSVMDPTTGKHKLYDINSVSKNTEHAWGYSPMGYGKATWYDANGNVVSEYNQATYYELDGSWYHFTGAGNYRRPSKLNGKPDVIKSTSTTTTNKPATKPTTPAITTTVVNRGSLISLNQGPISHEYAASMASTFPKLDTTNITSSLKTSNIRGLVPTNITYYRGTPQDYSSVLGYNTDKKTGIDTKLMDANYNAFIGIDTYLRNKHREAWNICFKQELVRKCRDGSMITLKELKCMLSTQYFGLNGGTYGSIVIAPEKDENGNYKTFNESYFTKDVVAAIYAAAIISEHNKGNQFIKYPLSDAEKCVALLSAFRVIYGIENTIKYFGGSRSLTVTSIVNRAKDEDYQELLTLLGAVVEEVEDITESQGEGITNIDQLREISKDKKMFGKIRLSGLVLQARINSMLNGTTFWEEFAKLTREDANNSARNTPLTGSSNSLKNAIVSPRNIQEELLAKTVESAYIGESGGDYASVINDTNNKPSIGPLQLQTDYAKVLLKKIQGTPGLSSEERNVFAKYAHDDVLSRKLSEEELAELSGTISGSSNSEAIKAAIDDYSMRYYHSRFYNPHLAGYYDSEVIKDLRTLPMLADIGNTGPAHIWDTTGYHKDTSFMTHWKPVSKEKDFESAYNLLNDSRTYWKSSEYANGYMKRIKNTYERLKGFTFRKSVKPGELGYYFNGDTNPLGYGPLSGFSAVSEEMGDRVNDLQRVKSYTSTMGKVSDEMVKAVMRSTGLSESELGLALSSQENGGGEYSGDFSLDGEILTSLSGTDRDRFVAAAQSQVGYLEKQSGSTNLKSFTADPGDDNYSKYHTEMGLTGGAVKDRAWCNAFTSWAAKAANIPSTIVKPGFQCKATAEWFKGQGQYQSKSEYGGAPGDLIFFKNSTDNPRWTDHIGIVTSVDGNTIHTVEGNTSMKSGRGGSQGVEEKTHILTDSNVVGFATPAWTYESKTVDPRTLLSLGYGDLTLADNTYYGTDKERYLDIARSQLGYLEKKDSLDLKDYTANPGNNNFTKYFEEIVAPSGVSNGGENASWCNAFTSWVGKAAGIPESVIYRNKYGRCTETMNHYKNLGLFKSAPDYKGKAGDLVFFNWNGGKAKANHIGIVTGHKKNKKDIITHVSTIEGNTGSTNTGGNTSSGYDRVMNVDREFAKNNIIGFATPPWTGKYSSVTPSTLLSLGYGSPTTTRIDSPAYREQLRKSLDNQDDFKVTPKDFEAIGFGPGMTVDAGFDMTNTDSKLDQIFSVIAEWYDSSKKAGAAQSSATTNNVNLVNSNTTNVARPSTSRPSTMRNHKDNLVNHHILISAKQNVRNGL